MRVQEEMEEVIMEEIVVEEVQEVVSEEEVVVVGDLAQVEEVVEVQVQEVGHRVDQVE